MSNIKEIKAWCVLRNSVLVPKCCKDHRVAVRRLPVDVSRMVFPKFPKLKSIYASKSERRRRAEEIFVELKEKYEPVPNVCETVCEAEVSNTQRRTTEEKVLFVENETKTEYSNSEDDTVSLPPSKMNESQTQTKPVEANKDESGSRSSIEERYFHKWLKICRERAAQRAADLMKSLLEKPVVKPLYHIEDLVYKKWKSIHREKEEMKKILYLNWTSHKNPNYSFEHSRYLKEYGKNPLRWEDSKFCISSCGLEVKSARKWLKIDESVEKLQHAFFKNSLSSHLATSLRKTEEEFMKSQRKILERIEESSNFQSRKYKFHAQESESSKYVHKAPDHKFQDAYILAEEDRHCKTAIDQIYRCLDGELDQTHFAPHVLETVKSSCKEF